MIAVCSNCSCSRGRRSWLSMALLFEDRDTDRNHPNRGLCLVVAAADCLPSTASYSLIQILSVAREGGIWPSRVRQGTNSAPHVAVPFACRLVLTCARRHRHAGLGSAKTGQNGAAFSRR
jgi:hypothetical protein